MKRKAFCVFLAVLLCLCGMPLTATAATEGDFAYTVENGKATLVSCNPAISGTVAIPAKLGGCPVTSISDGAFYYCEQMTAVTIPTTVTAIGEYAFYGCVRLTAVTIPKGVTAIKTATFQSCSNLKNITLPDGIQAIGEKAFYDCVALTTLSLPNSVSAIGYEAFRNCTALTAAALPEGVTTVPERAFAGCTALKEVTLPASLKAVANAAFSGCTALKDVQFGGSLAAWQAINVGTDNAPLTAATVHCPCEHNWLPATCSAPKTCAVCGATEGSPTTHNWLAPTCVNPKTCSICGAVQGQALGHGWEGATCTLPMTCVFCGDTMGRPLGHRPDADGICTRCGAGGVIPAPEVDAILTVGSGVGKAGDTVKLVFTLSHPAVKSFALTGFTYDTAKLELLSGEWATADGVIADWDETKQNGVVAFADNTALDGKVFVLTLRIKDGVTFDRLPVTCKAVAHTLANGKEVSLTLGVTAGEVRFGTPGNVDGNATVDVDDAVYLLYHTLLPAQYPLNQNGDMDLNGQVDSNDAIYLLYHALLPEQYPL